MLLVGDKEPHDRRVDDTKAGIEDRGGRIEVPPKHDGVSHSEDIVRGVWPHVANSVLK